MTFDTLRISASVIGASFARLPESCCDLLRDGELATATSMLRVTGVVTEREMLAATGGVNAHKGAIFTLLCLFGGTVIAPASPLSALGGAACVIRHLPHLWAPSSDYRLTVGQKALAALGLGGLRAEAAHGYPTIHRNYGLFIAEWRSHGSNFALVANLMRNMAGCNDTTVLNRKFDLRRLRYVQAQARHVLNLRSQGTSTFLEGVSALDRDFVVRDISPGGAADLTAATAFLAMWYGDLPNE